MAVFPIRLVIWSTSLVLWFPQSATESHGLDLCQKFSDMDEMVNIKNSTEKTSHKKLSEIKETFICLLDSTNELNCSWSFNTLEKDTRLSVFISVCNEETVIKSLSRTFAERVGSMSLTVSGEISGVVLHFNMSLHNWISYTYVYDMDTLEHLPPPANISASFNNDNLIVKWDLPRTRNAVNPICFENEVEIRDQEKTTSWLPKHHTNHTVASVDPSHSYSVRMRTRISSRCSGSDHWSEWSPTVTPSMEQSDSVLKPVVIVFICLGVPMGLLALLLFVRYQRVTKVLFPPIPRPPAKYKYFLEKSDAFNFFYSTPSTKPEEVITEVEDTGKNPGK
ncbi:interleukin-5 receptor subunit alpha-like isoform X2 [Simochromis diagramma]|uniref:interleukin-5 receptor subunit alpha-like isoform X2 n=1 Tax=Simochromis diagramma TaxID=43689 RepID=UPI001A7EC644|nr:interleukin-5 receptor subunit alpha-like isoform X2 [Simochromis diagramma]